MVNKELIETCSAIIARQRLTIAFAESATAGKLAFEFSQTEYSGAILKGALVCYNACVKEDILGVSKTMIDEYTPESPEVTQEMAIKLKTMMKADIAVAVTGLTSPGGSECAGKPVGTMFYCVIWEGYAVDKRKVFTGSPQDIINLTIEQIAKTIIKLLQTNEA